MHGFTFFLGKLCTNVHVFLFIQGSLAQTCMALLFVWGSFAQTCTYFFLFREALHKCAWLHFLFGEALHKRACVSFYSGKPCTNVHSSTFCLGKPCTKFTAPLFVWGSHVQSSRLHFLFGRSLGVIPQLLPKRLHNPEGWQVYRKKIIQLCTTPAGVAWRAGQFRCYNHPTVRPSLAFDSMNRADGRWPPLPHEWIAWQRRQNMLNDGSSRCRFRTLWLILPISRSIGHCSGSRD